MLNMRQRFFTGCFLAVLMVLTSLLFSFSNWNSVYATNYDLSNSSDYDARFTNVDASDWGDGILVADVNGDSYKDIIISDGLAGNNGSGSGSVYVIFGGADFSGDYDLSNSSNYNIRFDGETGWQFGRYREVHVGDVNDDGKDDLIIGSYYPNSTQGSIFVIFSTLIDDFNGTTGNNLSIDTDTDCPSNYCYNIRFNGSSQDYAVGIAGSLGISDLNADGKEDLIIGSSSADYSDTDAGSYFIIYSTLIDNYTTTGNILDLGTGSSYNIRFDGGTADDQIGYQGDFITGDINDDGKNDLLISSYKADYGGTNSGSVYIILSSIIDDYTDTGNNLSLSTSTNYNIRYDGSANYYLKHSVVGDVNGDSNTDLILGTPSYGGGYGMAWVIFSGLIDGIESSTGVIRAVNASANHNVRFKGDRFNGNLTEEGIYIGDINGDGLGDLLMNDGNDGNALFVVYSTYLDDFGETTGNYRDLVNGSSFNIEYNGPPQDPIGYEEAVFINDLDDDGYDDLIIGDYYANGVAGALWTVNSTKGSTITGIGNVYSIDSSDNYTDKFSGVADSYLTIDRSVVLSDLNGDGAPEFIIGARGASVIYVIYGIPANTTPNDPSSLGASSLVNGSYVVDNTPTLEFTLSDPDSGDTVKYQIQIDNDSDFSSVIADYTSALAAQGATSFTVGQAAGSGSYTTGSEGQTLADDDYYWRVKTIDERSVESSFATANSGSIAFRIDTTEPVEITLDSPGGGEYINSQRPTFRWKTTSDSGSGLSKYKLEINNGDSGGNFSIDNIPTSRTSDYENNQYIISYSGFSDGDSDNNYISVTTKSTTDWPSDQNEGKLKEGKRTWTVVAEDSIGNQRTASREINVDLTTPQLSNIAIFRSGFSFTIEGSISDTKAGSNDNESDYIRSNPDKVEIEIIRKGLGFSTTEANVTINLSNICDYSDTTLDTLTCSFEKELEEIFPYGGFVAVLTGSDKAGNSSTTESTVTPIGLAEKETSEELEPTPTPIPLDEVISEPIINPDIKKSSKKIGEIIKTIIQRLISTPKNIIDSIVNAQVKVVMAITNFFSNPQGTFNTAIVKITNRIGYLRAAIFPGAKTQITEIEVLEITNNSAVIVWKTNHPATSKVNYGKSSEFEESVYDTTPVKNHIVKLENLESDTEIFFEVISEGRTTSYDAYRTFKTGE